MYIGSHTLNEDYVVVLSNFVIKILCIDCKRKKKETAPWDYIVIILMYLGTGFTCK